MKICQFIFGPMRPGGMEYVMHHLSNAFARAGHEVTCYILLPSRGTSDAIPDKEDHLYNVRRFRALPRIRSWPDVLVVRRLLKEISREGFDVVHCHFLYPAGYLVARAGGPDFKNYIVTSHGADIEVDQSIGYGLRLDPEVDRKIKWLFEHGRLFTACSKNLGDKMIEAGLDRDKFRPVYNGVWLDDFSKPRENNIDRPYFLTAGRLVPKKGHLWMLEAYREFCAGVPDPPLWLLAGEGPERGPLQTKINEWGLQDLVRFCGLVIGDELISLYQHCIAHLTPSLYEPFGMVNIEAFAAGRTVIASRVGGIPEIIEDRVNGLLVDPGDTQAACSSLKRIFEDVPFREQLAKASAESARDYDWPVIAEQYRQCYLKVLDQYN